MKKQTYSEKLKDPRWQKLRLLVLERDGFMCQCCGDETNPLNIHHKLYIFGREVWEYSLEELTTFCEDCHKQVTDIKKEIKLTIDLNFDGPDYLGELKNLIDVLKHKNPYEISLVTKFAEKKRTVKRSKGEPF